MTVLRDIERVPSVRSEARCVGVCWNDDVISRVIIYFGCPDAIGRSLRSDSDSCTMSLAVCRVLPLTERTLARNASRTSLFMFILRGLARVVFLDVSDGLVGASGEAFPLSVTVSFLSRSPPVVLLFRTWPGFGDAVDTEVNDDSAS